MAEGGAGDCTFEARGFSPAKRAPASSLRLWRLSLDLPPAKLTALAKTLSPDETARAARFRLDADRRRFIAGRGLLRGLLGRALDKAPDRIAFHYGLHGKPALAGADGRLRFSLSHSGDAALVALAFGRDVGVDVECLRPDLDAAPLAARFLPAGDAAFLLSLPHAERADAFFRAWVRHEAYLKALGLGFAAPAPSFDEALWTRFDLDVGPDHRAAVVVAPPPPIPGESE